MANNRNAELKISWVTGIVYAAVATAITLVMRYVVWMVKLFNNLELFPDSLWTSDVELMLNNMLNLVFWIGLLLPVTYLICYRGYMRRAAVHPENLRGVAKGTYGRPWIAPVIAQLVGSIVWILISGAFIYFSAEMDFSIVSSVTYDRPRLTVFLICLTVFQAVDFALLIIGCKLFKPAEVRRNA